MKKSLLRLIGIVLVVLVAASYMFQVPSTLRTPPPPSPFPSQSGENYPLSTILPEGSFAYSGTLEVAGVGPNSSFEDGILDDTLALSSTNVAESSTDHLFINADLWKAFSPNDEITLPGTAVYFDGIVYTLQGAAGNHYYQVASIATLEKVATPTKGEERTEEAIRQQLDQRNYCEVDSDCQGFYAECPFGCFQTVHKAFVQLAQQLIKDRREKEAEKGNPLCVYSCMQPRGVQCREQKCVTRSTLPKSYPAQLEIEDLEWFRESPEDTEEILQERRKIVDDYLNGIADYQDCQLSENGKYVVCTEESSGMNIVIEEPSVEESSGMNITIEEPSIEKIYMYTE